MLTIDQSVVFKRITNVFRNEWPVETAGLDLTADTPVFYAGIGLDSVDGATLLLALEEEFDIEIEKESLGQDHFETIGRLTELISLLIAA